MQTLNCEFRAELEVKKSKFIAVLCPFADFERALSNLKKDHPKAAHIAWAYRAIGDFRQIVENQSDDGEPKGSAGAPILDVMRGAQLVEAGVLVARYFGGVKLGVGGLVRAYGGAANLAINAAGEGLFKFEFKFERAFFVPFALLARFEHYFESSNLKASNKEFGAEGCEVRMAFTKDEEAAFRDFASAFAGAGFRFLA